jgi:ADP-ribose pyrophosphatase
MESKDILAYRPTKDESKWKIESREVILENDWHRYVHDKGKTSSGDSFDYYYIQVPHSAGVIAVSEGKLVLVRQYRYTTARESLEVPGGTGHEENESPEKVAERELLEETGYEAKAMIPIGEFDVANGYSSDIAQVFLATDCKKIKAQNLESTEKGMSVELHPIEDVYEMVQDGKITDSFTLTALMLAWPHLL